VVFPHPLGPKDDKFAIGHIEIDSLHRPNRSASGRNTFSRFEYGSWLLIVVSFSQKHGEQFAVNQPIENEV
jgi:hypothetical protein